MASLFRGNRRSAQLQLNNVLPHFEVLYIGRSQARSKMGRECTKAIVEELVQKSKSTPELQRVSVVITSKGIAVREISETNSRETFIPIYDVTYGAADKAYRNVFSFVTNYSYSQNNTNDGRRSSFDSSRPFVCHAFLCRDAAMARAMVVYLVRAFKVGFESWKRATKSQELREKIRAGPGQGGSSADETINKSSSSGSEGTVKKLDVDGINNLSPRRTVPPKVKSPATPAPPHETATHVDKVSKWLDQWLNVGQKKTPSKSRVINTSDSEEKQEREFSKRMKEYANPDTLNVEVDIKSELEDPEVRSVLEEMADQTEKDAGSSDGSDPGSDSQGSTSSDNAPSVKKVTRPSPVGILQNKGALF